MTDTNWSCSMTTLCKELRTNSVTQHIHTKQYCSTLSWHSHIFLPIELNEILLTYMILLNLFTYLHVQQFHFPIIWDQKPIKTILLLEKRSIFKGIYLSFCLFSKLTVSYSRNNNWRGSSNCTIEGLSPFPQCCMPDFDHAVAATILIFLT